MTSISQVAAERARSVERLAFGEDQKTSQWIHAAPYRACFCIAISVTEATWRIQGLLPSGAVIQLAYYRRSSSSGSSVFNPNKPRYIKEEVMCGLPIRFVSTVEQPNSETWVALLA